MAHTPFSPQITPIMPRIVHVLAFANAQVLDVTGPLQVFASTNDLARQRGLPLPYAVTVIAAQAEPVMTSAGLALVAEPLPAIDAPCDTLVIAGGWGVYGAAEDPALVDWVREKARHMKAFREIYLELGVTHFLVEELRDVIYYNPKVNPQLRDLIAERFSVRFPSYANPKGFMNMSSLTFINHLERIQMAEVK